MSGASSRHDLRPRLQRAFLYGLLLAGVALLAGSLGYALAQARRRSAPPLPDLGPAPAYTGFRNQLGRPVDARDFAGRVQVVTFLFPYCTSQCPLIALHLVALEHALRLAHLARRVRIVSFNVDPAHTGPAQAAAFQREYGWNPRDLRWQFLSGTPAQTRRVVRAGFHVDYRQLSFAQEAANAAGLRAAGQYVPAPRVANALAARARPDYDIAHDDALALVGPRGRIRWFSGQADDLGAARLLRHIRAVLRGG